MEKNPNSFNFESFDLIEYIIKRIKPLIIITATAAIVSVIVALIITPRFKSTVILFPTSQGSVSQNLLGVVPYKTILRLGKEEEVEQLLQILNSDVIKNRIIEKYNLMEHYGIDPNAKYPLTAINEEFDRNISFAETEYMSIKIEVLDVNAQLAADIANDIAVLVDTAIINMQKKRAYKALKIVEHEYFDLKYQIESLEDSLSLLRSYGINDYESQSEVFNDAYARALVENNMNGAKKLEKKLEIIAKYGGAYVAIRDFLEFEKKQLSEMKAKYVEAKVDATQDLPHTFIVNHARKAEKKSYPVRWLICSVSTISTFIFALLLLLIFDYAKGRYFAQA